jgi:putative redox protein
VAHVELTWTAGQHSQGVDSAGHGVALASGGEAGVRPSEALLLALAACAAHDVVVILRKQRAALARLAVLVDGEQAPEPPRAYRRIHLRFVVAAAGASVAKLRRAADLALNTYCAVRASLAPEIDVTFEVILEEAGSLSVTSPSPAAAGEGAGSQV